jgi:2,3-dihydroxy-2,3-dihydro-p-cumate dehydrogenase
VSSSGEPADDVATFAVSTQCSRYADRVAVVTGAAQGLGLVIARRLGEEGADVLLADVQEAKLRRAADQLSDELGRDVATFVGDLARLGVADLMVVAAVEAFGRIDVLVNNAAALIRYPLVDIPEALMQQAVDWNLWNTVRCCKAVLPAMLRQRYGRIVNIGGEAWRTGAPFHTLLAGVGKGAMVGLTATLAGEVVRQGITVNCVSPAGFLASGDGEPSPPPSSDGTPWTPPEVLEALGQRPRPRNEIDRLAHPTEIAAAVAFFGSSEASYVTGQHLGVSGGLAML